MKKIFILTVLIALGTIGYAQVNMPSEPTFGKANVKNSIPSSAYKKQSNQNYTNINNSSAQTSRPTGDSNKAKLDSLAMSALRAAQNHNDTSMQSYIEKMVQNGAEGFSSPQIISKKTPHCPPIRITVNGKTLSGNKCAAMAYIYKNKQYEVGFCN